jgi:TnpA family transposase
VPPRLAGLSRRKLYLPKGLIVPARLEPIIQRVSFGRQTSDGWDGLLRVAASLKEGYGSVATNLDRNGSAARGSPVFEAGTAAGKVLRSLFLLDYLSNPIFRRELHRTLAQGESVHQLQRALLAGDHRRQAWTNHC